MNDSPQIAISPWLLQNGPRELEELLRAIVFHPSSAVLIADDERNYQDASVGASRFLGQHRRKLIGRRVEDFGPPAHSATISESWQKSLLEGVQIGTLQLSGPDGATREVEYEAKMNLLPFRHLMLLRDKPPRASEQSLNGSLAAWAEDYGMMIFNSVGAVVAFYGGAERIYGYKQAEVIGWAHSRFYAQEANQHDELRSKLNRATSKGHASDEGWHLKKDGSRIWVNVITTALWDDAGVLQGFASIARNFTDRHARDEKLRNQERRPVAPVTESSIVGVVSGEFDEIIEINDALLKMVGYEREDVASGHLNWTDLTPREFSAQDEIAHEEGLRFGASSPVEKELVCKDGSRIPVLIATAVLKLKPYRWIAFVTDLRKRDQQENVHFNSSRSLEEFSELIGSSDELRRALDLVKLVAGCDATVLILGETGTGKELIARAVHRLSARRNLPFITLNCAAVPSGLLESELFGYEKGAFTGAMQRKPGRFELANRGTLFLDEIGDIPMELQPKLLRALQEKSIDRLGSMHSTETDVRLVAATNRNLKQMMADNLFREDLYYRLKVFPISLPPLRDRPDDISLLAKFFTKKYSDEMGRSVTRIPTDTLEKMRRWRWPGNIRELENFIEKSVILSPGHILLAPIAELQEEEEVADAALGTANFSLDDMERAHILRVLAETRGVVTAAAHRLRIPRTTLHGLMKRLGIAGRASFTGPND